MTTPTNKPIEPVTAWVGSDFFEDPDLNILRFHKVWAHDIEVLITPLTQSHAEEKPDWWTCVICGYKWNHLNRCKCCGSNENYMVKNMKILTSSTQVSEGDKFTHVEWSMYEKVLKENDEIYKKLKLYEVKLEIKECTIRMRDEKIQSLTKALTIIKNSRNPHQNNEYNELVEVACEALTSPPEGEREPTAEECLEWYDDNHPYIDYLYESESGLHLATIRYLGDYYRHKTLIGAMRLAMKSEAERK